MRPAPSHPLCRWGPLALLLAAALAAAGAWRWWSAARAPQAQAPSQCLAPSGTAAAPAGMVWVPAGRYTPGDTVYAEERNQRPMQVAGFWMDRTEVSNAQFAAFVAATGYKTSAERMLDPRQHPGLPPALMAPGALVFMPPAQARHQDDPTQWWRYVPGAWWQAPGGPGTHIRGREAYPVVAVTLEDAQAYAHWAGRELPTETEWEWAARQARDEPMPAHEQPLAANTWHGPFPVKDAAVDGYAGLAPVGCYAPNALGLSDMIGNVWELTRSPFGPHAAEPPPGSPRRAAGPAQVVIKGGSYLCSSDYCMRYRAGARQPQDVDLGSSHVGFRTVWHGPPPTDRSPP